MGGNAGLVNPSAIVRKQLIEAGKMLLVIEIVNAQEAGWKDVTAS